MTYIGSYSFFDCRILADVTIPDSVITIGSGAFDDCMGLEYISIPGSVANIEAEAFENCNTLKTVILNPGLISIGYGAFSGCVGLLQINISDSVTRIEDNAFWSCSSLTQATIGTGVETIGSAAFMYCENLIEVDIPANVTAIESGVFYYCTKLESIHVDEDNPVYCSKDGILYNKEKTTLIVCPGGISGQVEVPDGISSIWNSAFLCCKNITEVVLPNGILNIGSNAFYDCEGLSTIVIPASTVSIGTYAFNECTNLKKIYFHGDHPEIGEDAFFAVVATAYYPQSNDTWSPHLGGYGGTITWTDALPEDGQGTQIEGDPQMFTFCYASGKKDYSATCYYTDDYFSSSSVNNFNASLATMSMCLAWSAFGSYDGHGYDTQYYNAQALLEAIGFARIDTNDWFTVKPTTDSIGVIAGSKRLSSGKTLIAVAIRGSGYESEWASNFTMGTQWEHDGFEDAKTQTILYLRECRKSAVLLLRGTGRNILYSNGRYHSYRCRSIPRCKKSDRNYTPQRDQNHWHGRVPQL